DRAVELGRAGAARQLELLAVGNDDELLVLNDEPLAMLGGRLGAALGRHECAAQAVDVERQIDAQRCAGHEPRSPTSLGSPAREAAGTRSATGASTPSFLSAGMTSPAKSRMLASASSYGIPA